jgi:hypothetical protein
MSIKIHNRLKRQLLHKGNSINEVEDMATGILRKHGILKDDKMELTDYGVTRDKMSPSERAIDRAVKISGRDAEEYNYSPHTNRATLKEKITTIDSRSRRNNAL